MHALFKKTETVHRGNSKVYKNAARTPRTSLRECSPNDALKAGLVVYFIPKWQVVNIFGDENVAFLNEKELRKIYCVRMVALRKTLH